MIVILNTLKSDGVNAGSNYVFKFDGDNMTMKHRTIKILFLFLACAFFTANANARTSLLNEVNSVCGTAYDCVLCHIDPDGGGELNQDGKDYDGDACFFCPDSPACSSGCSDGDGDGFFAEDGCGTAIDCDDFNASINPGAAEICDDTIDNDCDDLMDCADGDCTSAPVCNFTAEVCDNGVDDDGDRKIDCADKKDCRSDIFCTNPGPVEICNDGIDNDNDNKIDCADKKDCNKSPSCAR